MVHKEIFILYSYPLYSLARRGESETFSETFLIERIERVLRLLLLGADKSRVIFPLEDTIGQVNALSPIPYGHSMIDNAQTSFSNENFLQTTIRWCYATVVSHVPGTRATWLSRRTCIRSRTSSECSVSIGERETL